MKTLFIFLVALFVFGSAHAQERTFLSIDISDEIVEPQEYIVSHCKEEIVIDGEANETCWRSAPFTDKFIDIEGEKIPKYDTRFKMIWDSSFLYVYAYLEDPHIWGDITTRDAVIFYNNDFEVFLSPSKKTRHYGEIEINALGTVWDLSLDRPYRDKGIPNNHWNLDSLKSEIFINGTLNDATDIDSFWTVEMAIPLQPLMDLKRGRNKIPREGEQWRANFSRVQWDHDIIGDTYQRSKNDDDTYLKEYNWVWSNQNIINMHEPEKWGTIQFTHFADSEEVKFRKEKHRLFEQIVFAAFRETKNGRLKHLTDQALGYTQNIQFEYGSNELITGTFLKTNFGFEYSFDIPSSNLTFLINEAGEFKVEK